MEGWRPVEDIVRWRFGQAPVVLGWNFRELPGIDPFVIDQMLADLGGTAGILTGEEPPETLLTEDGA